MGNQNLPKKLHAQISKLCEEGDALTKAGDDHGAYAKYDEAWNLVPEDKADWEASTWILAAIGELQFRHKKFEKSLNTFLRAVQCPTGLGNPYIHLRIGQSLFELGNKKGAGDNLARAYMGAGEEIFEHEDPKYLKYLKSVLKPPLSKEDS
jgi:tetratricopeptide (TPR) repeat protein